MAAESLLQKAEAYFRSLCVDILSRRVGSDGNRAATDLFARVVSAHGFATETPPFDCIDWRHEGADLTVADTAFEVTPSPYALGCRVHAPLAVVSSQAELEATDLTGHIVLLRGEIAREQLMPKNFPFYNPDHHRQIIHTLETGMLAAVVAATSQDLVMVGAQYPFPLIEDGDFAVPVVHMTEEEGRRLAALVGQEVFLHSRAWRIPTTGSNVVAHRGAPASEAPAGESRPRVVLFAHIDARLGTPGANDNASGVVVLLLLAELLAEYDGDLGIELVAMNGEDYFSSPGEKQWLAHNEGRFDDILLGINLDDVAYHRGDVAYSLYNCPGPLADAVQSTFARYDGLAEGQPWVQGDHGLFILHGIPALAFTSDHLEELMATITHTPHDTIETVDPAKTVLLARALYDLLLHLS